jgi:hypothetical protein
LLPAAIITQPPTVANVSYGAVMGEAEPSGPGTSPVAYMPMIWWHSSA